VLPTFYGKIIIYPSAIAIFYVSSDILGVGGMCCECICVVKLWRKGPGHYDTIFTNTDPSVEGMCSLDVTHVQLLFSFSHNDNGTQYPCALIHWFSCMGDSPNDNTCMWMVKPDTSDDDNEPITSIIHLDTIIQAAHLLPVFGHDYISWTLSFIDTLNTFTRFYVNKYVDHHAFEIAF
jgi:hypothetical protein